ncbi:MAG TPA: hypothetical protein VLJ15_07510 [Gammaproteobacteria bacterium]|nr:hypothetical protein [Gammaproteobacteria bacterium]
MPEKFISFIRKQGPGSEFVQQALAQMQQSCDRFSNALDMVKADIELPQLMDLANQYIDLISTARLVASTPPAEDGEQKNILQPASELAVKRLVSRLIKVACDEVLVDNTSDDENETRVDALHEVRLHPMFATLLKLHPEASVAPVVAGFAHYIFMRMVTTDTFKNAFQTWMDKGNDSPEWLVQLTMTKQMIDGTIRTTLKNSVFLEQAIQQSMEGLTRAELRRILDGYKSSGFFRRQLNATTLEIDNLNRLITSDKSSDSTIVTRDQVETALGKGHRANLFNGTDNPDDSSTDKTIVEIKKAFRYVGR